LGCPPSIFTAESFAEHRCGIELGDALVLIEDLYRMIQQDMDIDPFMGPAAVSRELGELQSESVEGNGVIVADGPAVLET
jgi:hypothetical protein